MPKDQAIKVPDDPNIHNFLNVVAASFHNGERTIFDITGSSVQKSFVGEKTTFLIQADFNTPSKLVYDKTSYHFINWVYQDILLNSTISYSLWFDTNEKFDLLQENSLYSKNGGC